MSTPRSASSLILVRDGTSGLEVFMMKRHIRSDFVGGAHVFPGGALDASDAIYEQLVAGRTDASASETLKVPAGGLAYWVAAIRECFEEAGVLLAYTSSGELLDFSRPEIEERFQEARSRLAAGSLSLADLATSEGLRLAADRLHYWAHWITPAGQARRYDARFFLAIAPTGQRAAHDGQELTDSTWVEPREALRRAESGEWTLILPTLRNLIQLSAFATAAEAERAARERRDVPAIEPKLVRGADGVRILIPGDPGFEAAESAADASDPEVAAGSLERARRRDPP